MNLHLPFAAKEMPNGKKIFRRKHGYEVSVAASGNTSLVVSVPYPQAKINELEIIGLPVGTAMDIKILDTPTGTISGTPNALLNQFGFDIRVTKDWYKDMSQYDADVFENMQIELIIKNTGGAPLTAWANIVFHEIRDP